MSRKRKNPVQKKVQNSRKAGKQMTSASDRAVQNLREAARHLRARPKPT